jgi:hypothetical protein
VTRDAWALQIGQFAIDDMQIRTADGASLNLDP